MAGGASVRTRVPGKNADPNQARGPEGCLGFCLPLRITLGYKEGYMEKLLAELKVKIIETLSLLDVSPEDIADDAQLVGGSLGIDSIDVLELVLMLEKDYGVKIETKEVGVTAFASLRALAEFVQKNRMK